MSRFPSSLDIKKKILDLEEPAPVPAPSEPAPPVEPPKKKKKKIVPKEDWASLLVRPKARTF
jgi:hypothetical protein